MIKIKTLLKRLNVWFYWQLSYLKSLTVSRMRFEIPRLVQIGFLPTLKQQLNLRPQWQYQDTNTVIFSKLYLVLKFKSIGQGKIWFDSQIVRRDFFFSLFFLFLFSLLVTNWMQFNFYIPNPTFTSTFINLASFSLWPRYLLSHPDVVCQGIWKV